MRVLRELFPFSLVVNSRLQVLGWGDSLRKVAPDTCQRGNHLNQLLSLDRPGCGDVTSEQLLELSRQGQSWRLKESQLRLRGQLVLLPKARFFLAFAPVPQSLQQLQQLGLEFGDLGTLDNSIEFLLQAQLQEVAMADSNRLRQVLQKKNNELTRQRLELETAQVIAQMGSLEGPAEGPYVFSRNLYRLLGLAQRAEIELPELLAHYPALDGPLTLEALRQGGTFDIQLDERWHRWTVYRSSGRISGTVQDISLQKRARISCCRPNSRRNARTRPKATSWP